LTFSEQQPIVSTRPHAFIAMPFGRKPGPEGVDIDFNRIYKELLVPAIEAAGLSPFRADQELNGGSILQDMFQQLLVADLVVADLTIPNPNVWYELGVRHALRSRGVVLMFAGKSPSAFDLYTDRKLRYSLLGDGPDPARLEHDRKALTDMVRGTMASWHERKISPVYYHLPNLQEPDWKSLRHAGGVKELWDQHDRWLAKLEVARENQCLGDLLVLADEGPVAAFRGEAWICAGIALRKSGQFALALEYLRKGLKLEPGHLAARRELGLCMQRLAYKNESGFSALQARQQYDAVLEDHPKDAETRALCGRLDKDAWVAAWRRSGASVEQQRIDAAYEDALLRSAIGSYERAYRSDPSHYFSGINALTLMHLAAHLGVQGAGDEHRRTVMAGAVRFAAENEADPKQRYWALASLGDLEVLAGTPESVTAAYKEALAVQGTDWFAVNSSRDQLKLLADLGFRPQAVNAGLAVLDRKFGQMERTAAWQPRQVLLFSGHMMDAPGRVTPRFPPSAEPLAAKAIADALDALGADSNDLALCQAAAGGDLLFLEACQQRSVNCQVMLPFPEPEFIQRSVRPSSGGQRWVDRFTAAVPREHTKVKVMPVELGELPAGGDPFERANLWLLYTALALGVQKVRFITLWNGGGGDGPGGTAHMLREVERHTGRVVRLDTRDLFKKALPQQAQ
jgi:tetratricopeptide (TPR) repeat protein